MRQVVWPYRHATQCNDVGCFELLLLEAACKVVSCELPAIILSWKPSRVSVVSRLQEF